MGSGVNRPGIFPTMPLAVVDQSSIWAWVTPSLRVKRTVDLVSGCGEVGCRITMLLGELGSRCSVAWRIWSLPM